MDKILIISHCILNTSSKVISNNTIEIQNEADNREKLLTYVIKNNIQLLQLPCPEFVMYGSRRWGHVKEQFDHPFFRKQCKKMLIPIVMQLKEYASNPERYDLLAIVAIDGSPSCGYRLTCRGDWGGELSDCPDFDNKLNSLYPTNESGIFMEELKKLLDEEHLEIPIKDLSYMIGES